jgi:putative membrane protein
MMGFYGYNMSGWMWVVGTLMMLLFWGGLAALIVVAVRAFAGPRGTQESADEILKRRLAAGQITQDEYDKTRQALHG